MIKNTNNENIYCCNGFCSEKDRCWRFQFTKYTSAFEKSKCLYLHIDKDNCLLIIEEDQRIG